MTTRLANILNTHQIQTNNTNLINNNNHRNQADFDFATV